MMTNAELLDRLLVALNASDVDDEVAIEIANASEKVASEVRALLDVPRGEEAGAFQNLASQHDRLGVALEAALTALGMQPSLAFSLDTDERLAALEAKIKEAQRRGLPCDPKKISEFTMRSALRGEGPVRLTGSVATVGNFIVARGDESSFAWRISEIDYVAFDE